MSSISESSAGPSDQAVPNGYDSFAEGYTAENEANLINGYYGRPAILNLAGDVAGRRVLDAGCGSGPIAAALRDRGATVTGLDSSAGMLEQARRRIGPDADLRPAAARHDRRVHCGRFPDSRHQRAAACTGHPSRAALRLHQGRQPLGILRCLVVLRPGGQLFDLR
jgi:predicted TPR repeat methyltransferase